MTDKYENLDRFEIAEIKRQKIIAHLRANPDSTSRDIEKLLGVAKASAANTLRRMHDRGEVSRKRHTQTSGFYYTWTAERDPISADEVKQAAFGFSTRRQVEIKPAVQHVPVHRLFGGL